MPRTTPTPERKPLGNFGAGDKVRIVGTDIVLILLQDRGERTELEDDMSAYSCLCVDDNWTLRRVDGGSLCELIEDGDSA